MVTGVCAAASRQGELRYSVGYPPVINTAAAVEFARTVATEVGRQENADANCTPSMGGEDFSYMLQEQPGCYSVIGPGAGGPSRSCRCTTRAMTFCDAIISQWRSLFLASGRARPAPLGEMPARLCGPSAIYKQQEATGYFGDLTLWTQSNVFDSSDIWCGASSAHR